MALYEDASVLYWHSPGVLLSEDQSTFVPNATGALYESVDDANTKTNAVAIYDTAGNEIAALQSNYRGEILPFQAEIPIGYVNFGSVIQEVIAGRDLLNKVLDAAATVASYEVRLSYLEANGVGSGGIGGGDTFTETFPDTF